MKRVRLTSRNRKAESQADGLFPGDVGNMERSKNYHKMDDYHKFEQTVNHELPDMRHEWKDDKRDENNIPVPKVASLYAAAQNAIKLSMMLLGDKAPQKTIEAQARDFMKLGNTKLVASMNRWLETEECEECVEGCDDKVAEEEVVEEQPMVEEEMVEEEQPVAPVADEMIEEAQEEETVEAEEEMIEEETEEIVESDDEEIIEEEMEIAEETSDLNTEVDFENISEEETVEADEELQAIFENDTEDDENEVMTSKVASKKKGIKKIAGQPKLVRVASKKADELEGLWSKLDVPGIN